MTHGLQPQAGWDPVDSAARIEAKAQELAGIAARMKAALQAGNPALVRDRMAVAEAANAQCTAQLVLLRRSVSTWLGDRG